MRFSYFEVKLASSEGNISVFSTARSQHMKFLLRNKSVTS